MTITSGDHLAAGVLTIALEQIKASRLGAKESAQLMRAATQQFVCASQPSARALSSEALADLEKAYSLLSRTAQTKICRPSAAVAFLRALGLNSSSMDKRMSHLSVKRRCQAHPDSCFFADVTTAIEGLDPQLVAEVASSFVRPSPPEDSTSPGGSETSEVQDESDAPLLDNHTLICAPA